MGKKMQIIEQQTKELEKLLLSADTIRKLSQKISSLKYISDWRLAEGNTAYSTYPYSNELEGIKKIEYIDTSSRPSEELYSYGFENNKLVALIPPYNNGLKKIISLFFQSNKCVDMYYFEVKNIKFENDSFILGDEREITLISIIRDFWISSESRVLIQVGKRIKKPLIKEFVYENKSLVKCFETREWEGNYMTVELNYIYKDNILQKIVMPKYNNYAVYNR